MRKYVRTLPCFPANKNIYPHFHKLSNFEKLDVLKKVQKWAKFELDAMENWIDEQIKSTELPF